MSIQLLRNEVANLLWAMQLLIMIVPLTDLFKKMAHMEAGMYYNSNFDITNLDIVN